MAALASDWLRHFRLLFWNRWTEFNETWQDARSQRPLPTLCFLGRSVNKNVHLGRFLKKVAHCCQVHDMWPFGPLVRNYHVIKRIWNEFSFHTVFMKLVVCFISPCQRLGDINTQLISYIPYEMKIHFRSYIYQTNILGPSQKMLCSDT